jgi:hypothetical protein
MKLGLPAVDAGSFYVLKLAASAAVKPGGSNFARAELRLQMPRQRAEVIDFERSYHPMP